MRKPALVPFLYSLLIPAFLMSSACKPPKEEKESTKPAVVSIPAIPSVTDASSSLSGASPKQNELLRQPTAHELAIKEEAANIELMTACTFDQNNSVIRGIASLEERLLDHNTGVEHLLSGLAEARTKSVTTGDNGLLFLDVYWLGCKGCNELLSTEKHHMNFIEQRTHNLKVSWKTGVSKDLPMTAAYQLFTQMVSAKSQQLSHVDNNGHVTLNPRIEDYRGHDRAHFPQLLFINPKMISRTPLLKMCHAQKRKKLFEVHPRTNKVRFYTSEFMGGSHLAVAKELLDDRAIYSQLLNENIFRFNNKSLNQEVVYKSLVAAQSAHQASSQGVSENLIGVWNARQEQPRQIVSSEVQPVERYVSTGALPSTRPTRFRVFPRRFH